MEKEKIIKILNVILLYFEGTKEEELKTLFDSEEVIAGIKLANYLKRY